VAYSDIHPLGSRDLPDGTRVDTWPHPWDDTRLLEFHLHPEGHLTPKIVGRRALSQSVKPEIEKP
jgi:hypothetical protein